MKMDVFKTAQNVKIHLGYFCNQICDQELSKYAQSGHTGQDDSETHRTINITLTRN